MSFHRIYLFIFCISCIGSAQAQFVPTTRYTTRDGMFTERITCMTQDSRGYMWFGTYFGVMRYDGYQWLRIDMPQEAKNKVVQCIRAVGEKVYAGVGFMGGFIEIQNGKARNIKLPAGYSEVSAITVHQDSSLTLVMAKMPASSSVDIVNYKKGAFTHLMEIGNEYDNVSIVADHSNRTWVGTNKGAFIIDKKKTISLVKDRFVESIALNENGLMALVHFENHTSTVKFYDPLNLKPVSSFSVMGAVIHPQHENNFSGAWGLAENKLVRIEQNGNVQQYQFDLPKRTVAGPVFLDREKNIWVSSEAGLYKFSNLKAQSWYFEEKGPTSTFILPTGNSKLITNGFGLYEYADNQLRKIHSLQSLSAYLFLDKKKNVWLTSWERDKGIWVASYKNHQFVPFKYFKNTSANLQQDAAGNIWMGGGRGFSIIANDEQRQQVHVTLHENKNVQIINFLLDEEKQIIWAGTSHYGLLKIKYSKDRNKKIHLQVVDRIDQSKGFSDLTIRGNIIKDSRGRLWIGTRNSGINRIEEKKGTYIIKNFSEKEGITCSRINWITQHDGYIWFAACDGAYQLSDAGVVKKYNTGDGLIEDYVLHVQAENDTLWVGTSQGMTRLQLRESISVPPPPVSISDVRILGISDSSLYNEGETSIPFSKNSVGFTFTGNTFINEKKTVFKYMLEGYEKKWSIPASVNNINYASLPPGSYTFRVLAQNAAGVWSKEPAIFRFRIVLPFYRSTWFYLFVLLLAGSIGYSVYRYRKVHQKKMEKLRASIARDLHDDIGSALGSINILSKTAQRKVQGDAEAESVMNKIGSTAQNTLESMDEIIWTINPAKEKVIDLVVRMQNFAQPLLESEGIEFGFTSDIYDAHKLNMDLKRNLYLVFKELITNAIRHAGCSKVEARLYLEQQWIILQVSDNGRGMDNTKNYDLRNGLANIKSRIENFNGSFSVNSENGKGTSWVIKAPTK